MPVGPDRDGQAHLDVRRFFVALERNAYQRKFYIEALDYFCLLKVGFVRLNYLKSPEHELPGRMLTAFRTQLPDGEVLHYSKHLEPHLAGFVDFSRYQRLVCQRGDQA